MDLALLGLLTPRMDLGGVTSSGVCLALTSFLPLSLQVIISFLSGPPLLRVRRTALPCSPTGSGITVGAGALFWSSRELASGDLGLDPNKPCVSSMPQSPLLYYGLSAVEGHTFRF